MQLPELRSQAFPPCSSHPHPLSTGNEVHTFRHLKAGVLQALCCVASLLLSCAACQSHTPNDPPCGTCSFNIQRFVCLVSKATTSAGPSIQCLRQYGMSPICLLRACHKVSRETCYMLEVLSIFDPTNPHSNSDCALRRPGRQ